MGWTAESGVRFGFAGFELDSERFVLTRNGEPVPVEPKPLKLLLHLLVRHPATVPKEEFLEALWPGERVTGDSLTRAVRAARVALGKAAGEAIVTVRGRGYRVGVPVERIDGDATRASVRDDVFVGRADVLAELRAAFERACEGRGGVALLSGEPGIGKTRTAEELARQCAEAGAEVAWGRAHRDEGMPALWPWLRLLGRLVERRPAEALDEQLGPGAAAVARVVPEVRERLPRLPMPETLAPEQERFRFFEAVTRFLERAAAERPLLLVLDDLHQADTASLQLFGFAGEALSRARVLLLGTHRDVGAPPNPALDAALGALARAESAPVARALGGLTEDEVGRLLGAIAPEHARPGKAREIHTRSGGNPFFVRELARLLARDGGAAATAIPQNVRAAIRARLAALRDDARQVLASASVIGLEFSTSILVDVAQRPRSEIAEALDEAEAAGFVCGADETPGGVRFAHPLVQETVYQSLSRRERSRLHERAGESIEARHAGRLEPHLASLARHFDEASLGASDERVVTYAERAARQDRARHAVGEAAEHYGRALRALERSPSRDLERRCDLLLELGEALLLDGASAEAMASFDEAADGARSADDAARLARAALARSATVTPVLPDPVALERVREALDRLGEGDPSLRLRLRARLATLRCASGDFEGATRLETEVVGATDRLADADAACDVLLEHLFVQQQHALADGSGNHLVLTDRILARHETGPAELHASNPNYVGGAITGGAADLFQLWTRPVARIDPYATPNPRIFLCSASTPPGGGVHGQCGAWAARSALRRLSGRPLRPQRAGGVR